MPQGSPFIVPAGALISLSDGRLVDVPTGTVATPTANTDKAGWVAIAAELVRAGGSIPGDTLIEIVLEEPPLVPGSLAISSVDPLVLDDDGTGTLTGPTGSAGTNTVDLTSGRGSCSFNADALGPIVADYQQFGISTGTVFILVGSDGTPLGMGTITLDTGVPLTMEAVNQVPTVGYAGADLVIDPDPNSPPLSYSNDNLDQETCDLIAAQLAECSELEQHEVELAGRNVPWIRRGVKMRLTDVHDENGEEIALPAIIIQERTLTVTGGQRQSDVRRAKGLGWVRPGILLPPGTLEAPSGDAATFTDRGIWQANMVYGLRDIVRAAPSITQVVFAAVMLGTGTTRWTFPAQSGPTTPFQALIGGLTPALWLEGRGLVDGNLFGWYGAHRVITLTGTVSGQTLLVRDRGGAEHYVTYYPDVDVWTDTPAPPGM